MVYATIVASEAVFVACPVSGVTVSIRFFVRFGLVIGFDRHKIRLDREVIKGDRPLSLRKCAYSYSPIKDQLPQN